MRILVTGGTGYLGSAAASQAAAAGHDVMGVSRSAAVRLDVAELAECRRVVAQVAPDVVIHTAYGQDDWRTTAEGAAHVAIAAGESGAHLVHVSSDAVFSGQAPAYDESAIPDPVNRYGAAKAAAEVAVRAVLPAATIVRTSLILGPDSFMERLVHNLAGGADGVLFADDIRCPVHRDDLAAAVLELAAERPAGMFHCGGPDAISRADIGRLIARRDGLAFDRIRIGSRASFGPGQQLDLRLDSRHTQGLLRTRLRGAREFL
ncbi:NAD-dependent epimerase/dehydratase family protein [Flexivirga caeni]|uniref:NAD-dependent epimerase/dehydratase family protein n=1 Tax=Flexivirga caeni TaxID=2294115 RepID=A0A3M9ME19_9MICO|nr:NAD-dependent epimerase/dehydratase family protein [Flexivirga caeni]